MRESELLFEVNESGKKMTVGGKGVRYKYPTVIDKMVGSDRPQSLHIRTQRFHAGQSR